MIVELLAKFPVAPLKVKIFLSPSKDITVAVIDVESEAIPVTVYEVRKSPDLSNNKSFVLNVKLGGLADN